MEGQGRLFDPIPYLEGVGEHPPLTREDLEDRREQLRNLLEEEDARQERIQRAIEKAGAMAVDQAVEDYWRSEHMQKYYGMMGH